MKTRPQAITEIVRGPRVLDVGCTGQRFTELHPMLRRKFPVVHGIDINHELLEQMRAQGYDNLHQASAETFELEERFETIVAGEVIEHLSNPGLFLARAKAHLAEGGHIVLSTPSPFALVNALYAWFKFPHTCENDEHTSWFCPSTIEEIVGRAGLRIRSIRMIEDYNLADHPLRSPYGFAARLIRAGGILPERLRCNAMLLVLEAA